MDITTCKNVQYTEDIITGGGGTFMAHGIVKYVFYSRIFFRGEKGAPVCSNGAVSSPRIINDLPLPEAHTLKQSLLFFVESAFPYRLSLAGGLGRW